jgi:hypothetical protein
MTFLHARRGHTTRRLSKSCRTKSMLYVIHCDTHCTTHGGDVHLPSPSVPVFVSTLRSATFPSA